MRIPRNWWGAFLCENAPFAYGISPASGGNLCVVARNPAPC